MSERGIEIEVELWSVDPLAIESVRATMRQLPGGDLIEREGRFYVPNGFPAWAAERQGYVRRCLGS